MNSHTIFSVTKALTLATFLSSNAQAASRAQYVTNAIKAFDVLNHNWYDPLSGQWQDFWWIRANMITTLPNSAALDLENLLPMTNYYFENTFTAARGSNSGSFLDKYFEDEGWSAMAWIRVYDLTQNMTYLDAAKGIFKNMLRGRDASCASLANRIRPQRQWYQILAAQELSWFYESGLLKANNLILDELDLATCKGTGAVYTFNQGVLLGALVGLHRLTLDHAYLDYAPSIAQATINHLTDSSGILTEIVASGPLNNTSAQGKGICTRNLAYLQSDAPNDAYVSFWQRNADAIWSKDQERGQLGPDWQGPDCAATAASRSSALDCLVAAAAVS